MAVRFRFSGRFRLGSSTVVIEDRVAFVDAFIKVFVVFHAARAGAFEINLLRVERAALVAIVIISGATIWNLSSANCVPVHHVPAHE